MHRRAPWWPIIPIALAVGFTGCATQPPAPTLLRPGVTASGPATPTPVAAPGSDPGPASITPTAASVVLAGTGVAGEQFGAAEAAVLTALTASLGAPGDTHEGVLCELDAASPWSRSASFGGLSVVFVALDQAPTSPRTLTAWTLRLDEPAPAGVTLADGVPLNLTFKQLKAEYPAATLEDTGLGDDSQILTLPDSLRFLGVHQPDLVQAGATLFCE